MKQRFFALVTALILTFGLTACQGTPPAPASGSSVPASSEASSSDVTSEAVSSEASQPETPAQTAPANAADNALYLQTYFSIPAFNNEVTWGELNDALTKAGLPITEGVNSADPVPAASGLRALVTAADLDELALTYPEEKIAERLKLHQISPQDEDAFFACATDTGLLSAAQAAKLAAQENLDGETASILLMAAVQNTGKGRHYLGYSNDPDIFEKLYNTWDSFTLFDDPQLTKMGVAAVQQKVTTGYNLKYAGYNANFLPDRTIQYGHSDIAHAAQLMGLLSSEEMVAKVQLEPKISVFEYLLEWGPVPEPSPTYEVKQAADNLYLTHAVEYDLLLEFNTPEEKAKFDAVIEQYAKKYEGNEEAVGLLYGSWWQPLYTSRVEMPAETYHLIYDNVVTNGDFSIHPFSLPENLESVQTALKAIDPALSVTPVQLWCNDAFYRYLKGDDFQ